MVLTPQARERFEEVQARVRPLLAKAGYAAPRFVPVSAMRGVNLGGGGGGGSGDGGGGGDSGGGGGGDDDSGGGDRSCREGNRHTRRE